MPKYEGKKIKSWKVAWHSKEKWRTNKLKYSKCWGFFNVECISSF
jgi:hypothetical protein